MLNQLIKNRIKHVNLAEKCEQNFIGNKIKHRSMKICDEQNIYIRKERKEKKK